MYRAPRHGHITANPSPQGFIEVYDLSYNTEGEEKVQPDLFVIDVPYYSADTAPQSGPYAGKTLTQEQAAWEKYIPGKSPVSYIRSQYSRGFRRFVADLADLPKLDAKDGQVSEFFQVPLTQKTAIRLGQTLPEGEIDEFKSGDMAKYLVGLIVNQRPYELVTRDEVAAALDNLNELLVNAKDKYRVAVPPIGCVGGGLTYGGDYGVYNLIRERLQPAVDAGHVIYLLPPKPQLQIQERTARGSVDPGINSPGLYTDAMYMEAPAKYIAITNSANADAYALAKLVADHPTFASLPKEKAEELIREHDEKRAGLKRKLQREGVTEDEYIQKGGPSGDKAERLALLLPSEDERNIERFAREIPEYSKKRQELIRKYRTEYMARFKSGYGGSQEAEPDYLTAMDIIEEYEKLGANSAVSEKEYAQAKEITNRSYLGMDRKRRKRALEAGRPIVEKLVSACLNEIRLEAEYEQKLAEVENEKAIVVAYSAFLQLADASNKAKLREIEAAYLPVIESGTEKEKKAALAAFAKIVAKPLQAVLADRLAAAIGVGAISAKEAKAAAAVGTEILTETCANEEARARILYSREMANAMSKSHVDDRRNLEDAARTKRARGLDRIVEKAITEVLPKQITNAYAGLSKARADLRALLDRKNEAYAEVAKRKRDAAPYLSSTEFMLSAITGLRPMLEAQTVRTDADYNGADQNAADIKFVLTLLEEGTDEKTQEAVARCAITLDKATGRYRSPLFPDRVSKQDSEWLHNLDYAFQANKTDLAIGLLTEAYDYARLARKRKLAAVGASEKTARRWRRRLPNIPNLDVFLKADGELTDAQREYKEVIKHYFAMSPATEANLRKEAQQKARTGEFQPRFATPEDERRSYASRGYVQKTFKDEQTGLTETMWIKDTEISTEADDIRAEIRAGKKGTAIARGLAGEEFTGGAYANYISGIEDRLRDEDLKATVTPVEMADFHAYRLGTKLEALMVARNKAKHELTGEDVFGPARTASGKLVKKGISELRAGKVSAELSRIEQDIASTNAKQHMWALRAKVLRKMEEEDLSTEEQDFISAFDRFLDNTNLQEIYANMLATAPIETAIGGSMAERWEASAKASAHVADLKRAADVYADAADVAFAEALNLAERIEPKRVPNPRTPNPYMYKSGQSVPGISLYEPSGQRPRRVLAGTELLVPVYGLKEKIARLTEKLSQRKEYFENSDEVKVLKAKIKKFEKDADTTGYTRAVFLQKNPRFREALQELEALRAEISYIEAQLKEARQAAAEGKWYDDAKVDRYYGKISTTLETKLRSLEDTRGEQPILPLDEVAPVPAVKESVKQLSQMTFSALRTLPKEAISKLREECEAIDALNKERGQKTEFGAAIKKMSALLSALPADLSDIKFVAPTDAEKDAKLNATTQTAAKLFETVASLPFTVELPGTPAALSYDLDPNLPPDASGKRVIQLTDDPEFGPRPLFAYENNKRIDRNRVEEIRYELAYCLYRRAQADKKIEDNIEAGYGYLPQAPHRYYEALEASVLPVNSDRVLDLLESAKNDLSSADKLVELEAVIDFLEQLSIENSMPLSQVRDTVRDMLGIERDPYDVQPGSLTSTKRLHSSLFDQKPSEWVKYLDSLIEGMTQEASPQDTYYTVKRDFAEQREALSYKLAELEEVAVFLDLQGIYREFPLSQVRDQARNMLGIHADPQTGNLVSDLFDRKPSQWVNVLNNALDDMTLKEGGLAVDTANVLRILDLAEDDLVPEELRTALGLPDMTPTRARFSAEDYRAVDLRAAIEGIGRSRKDEKPDQRVKADKIVHRDEPLWEKIKKRIKAAEDSFGSNAGKWNLRKALAAAKEYEAAFPTPQEGYVAKTLSEGELSRVLRQETRKLPRAASDEYNFFVEMAEDLKKVLKRETETFDIRKQKRQGEAAKIVSEFRDEMAKEIAQGKSGIDAYFAVFSRYRALGDLYRDIEETRNETSYLESLLAYNRSGRQRLAGSLQLASKDFEYDVDVLSPPAPLFSVYEGLTAEREAREEAKRLEEEQAALDKRAGREDAQIAKDLETSRLERLDRMQKKLDKASGTERVLLLSGGLLRDEYDELCLRAYEDQGLAARLSKSATAKARADQQKARALVDERVKRAIVAGKVRRLLPLDVAEDKRAIMTLPPGISPPGDEKATEPELLAKIRDLSGFRTWAEYLAALIDAQGEALKQVSAEVYRRRAALDRKKAGRGGDADEAFLAQERVLFDARNDSPTLSDFARAIGIPTQLEAYSGEGRYKDVQRDPNYIDLTGSKRDQSMEAYNKKAICEFVVNALEELNYKCSAAEAINPALALNTAKRSGAITEVGRREIAASAIRYALEKIVASNAQPTFVQPVSTKTGRMMAFGHDEIVNFLDTAGISPEQLGFGGKNLTLVKSSTEVNNNLTRLRTTVLRIMADATTAYYEELAERDAILSRSVADREQGLRDLQILIEQENYKRDMACLSKTPGDTIQYVVANSPESLVRIALPRILAATHDAVVNSLRGPESGRSFLDSFISKVTAPGTGITRRDVVSASVSTALASYEVKSQADVANILSALERKVISIAEEIANRGEIKLDGALKKATPGDTIISILTKREGATTKLRYHAVESQLLARTISAVSQAIGDACSPGSSALSKLADKPLGTLFERTAAVEEEFLSCVTGLKQIENELASLESRTTTPGALYPVTASQSSYGLEGDIQGLLSQMDSGKQMAKALIQQLNELYKQGNTQQPRPAVIYAIEALRSIAPKRSTAALGAIEGVIGAQQPRPTVLTFRDLPGAPQGQGKPPDRASNPGSAARYRDRMSGRRNNPEETLWHYADTGPVDLLTEGMNGSRSKRAMRRMNPETSPVISAFSDVFGMTIDTSACDTAHGVECERARCLVRLQRDIAPEDVSDVLRELAGDRDALTGTFLKRVARQAAQSIKTELRQNPHREQEITRKLQAAMKQCLAC